MRDHDFVQHVQKHGIENCIFMVPMRPLRSVLGMFSYKSSTDPQVLVPCRIVEDRYKLAEKYKVTLRAVEPFSEVFGQEHYYVSDLVSIIWRDEPHVQMYVRQTDLPEYPREEESAA